MLLWDGSRDRQTYIERFRKPELMSICTSYSIKTIIRPWNIQDALIPRKGPGSIVAQEILRRPFPEQFAGSPIPGLDLEFGRSIEHPTSNIGNPIHIDQPFKLLEYVA